MTTSAGYDAMFTPLNDSGRKSSSRRPRSTKGLLQRGAGSTPSEIPASFPSDPIQSSTSIPPSIPAPQDTASHKKVHFSSSLESDTTPGVFAVRRNTEDGGILGTVKELTAWDIYNNEARKVDIELVKDWRDSLNSLLVFVSRHLHITYLY